jgi:predicted ATP-binding protein involved in virulence
MHVQRIDLENYRGSRSLSLTDLDPHLNVLVGTNGAGKSTVLDAVALMLTWAVSRIRRAGTSGSPIAEDDIANGAAGAAIELVCCDDQDGDRPIRWRLAKARAGREKPAAPSHLAALSEYTRHIQAALTTNEATASLPIFVHYPVNRAVLDIPLRIRGRHSFDRLAAYDDALTGGANFRRFFEWFREREDLENEQWRNANSLFSQLDPPYDGDRQLNAVRRAIEGLRPEFSRLTVRRSPLRMEIEKQGEVIKVNQLSDGEKCSIALVSDLARRLAIANPQGENPLAGSGIVLIDEIDLHLHPLWQRTIVPKLIEIFPNCQFMISTHSPHVLTHVRAEHIIVLDRVNGAIEASQPREAYGKTVERILEDLMGLDTTRPIAVSEELHRIYDQISRHDLDGATAAIESMTQQVESAASDPEIVKARLLIQRKAILGK